MKIRRISAYRVDLPLYEGSYKWSGGKSVEVFDSTVVRIETDKDINGHGEVCPLGPVYLPAYAEGVRTGLAKLAPELIGENPCQLSKINRHMDRVLKGHPYVKSALDMACWDIAGQGHGSRSATCWGADMKMILFSTGPYRSNRPSKWRRMQPAIVPKGIDGFNLKWEAIRTPMSSGLGRLPTSCNQAMF